jgi:hypothetical protein
VAPGEEVTLEFAVSAPVNAGTYNFQWQMIRLTSGFFGAMSTNAAINVIQPTPPPAVATSTLSSGEVGLAYSQQLTVDGGNISVQLELKERRPCLPASISRRMD